jgi:hypothetical protein
MTFYHRKLWKYYGGKTDNIIRPTIVKASNAYFARQDIINSFLSQCICKLSPDRGDVKDVFDNDDEYLMNVSLIDLSTMFRNHCNIYKKVCNSDTSQIANKLANDSILRKILVGDPTKPSECKLADGFVALKHNQDEPEGGIRYPNFSKKNTLYNQDEKGELKSPWMPETSSECYERVKREYEKLNNETKTDSEIEQKRRDPQILRMFEDEKNKTIPQSIIDDRARYLSQNNNDISMIDTSDDDDYSNISDHSDFGLQDIDD